MSHDMRRVFGAHHASRGLRVPHDAYVPPACTSNVAPPRAIRTLLPIHSSKHTRLNFDVQKVGLLKTISILTLGSRMETWVLASKLLAIGFCVPVIESDTCWHWEKFPAPCGPCGPLNPRAPCEPLKPGGPMSPWGPCVPLNPWGPRSPVAPREPLKPRGPIGPSDLLIFSTYA